jgi:DNA invertase Pin-like site-specific DNA recombinase
VCAVKGGAFQWVRDPPGFDVLMFWSIDRLGRSTAAVTTALADLEAAGVAIYADKEVMDATTPHGRAMLQCSPSLNVA